MRTRQRTDTWLALLALALLLISPIENALSNNLPTLLPAPIRNHALLIFLIVLAALVVFDSALIPIRRVLAGDSMRARSRRLKAWNYTLTGALGVLGAAASVLGSLAVAQVPALTTLAQSSPWVALVLPLVLLSALIVLPLLTDWLSARPDHDVTDRAAFLRQLDSRYRRYLNDPLQHAVRARLDLRETPSALQQPEITVETLGASSSAIPPKTRTIARGETLLPLFEAARRQLLILGAPGSGKSTQLYALGRELVRQAPADMADPAGRLPVLLDLSTWASNKDLLETWLADQITESYGVRKDIAKKWVQARQILPLLDALDVMAENDRPLCVNAINAYLERHPADPLVVCSRREEYDHITGARLNLRQAVTLEPLSDEAILQALADGGARLAPLRQVVAADHDLMDAVRTPLLLSLVMLTYDDLRDEKIMLPRPGDTDAWRHELFRNYIERMLTRTPRMEQQSLDSVRDTFQTTLEWIAYELYQHDQNTFYLEGLQIDWLPNKSARHYYLRLIWTIRICLGVGVGLFGGIGIGLGTGLVSWLVSDIHTATMVGLGTGLVGLVGGEIVWQYFDPSERIEPIVRLTFPRPRLSAAAGLGIATGLFTGSVFGGLVALRFGLGPGIFIGLLVVLVAGLAVTLGVGPEQIHVREEDLIRPDEGIYHSVRLALLITLIYALDMGLGGGLFLAVLGGLRFGSSASWSFGLTGLVIGLAVGSVIGLAFGLGVGGVAALKYPACRRALLLSGAVPPHLVHFLDEASARVLLRRVGGGYQFIHQLLRDYFADQYIPPKDN